MGRVWLLIGLFLVVFALPAAGRAADDEHKKAAEAPGHKTGHDDPGQMSGHEEPDNFFKGLVDLSIWTILVFVVLLFILNKYAWPMMKEGLDKREQMIAHALTNAQRAQAEAERLRLDLETKMNQNAEQMRSLMEEARRNAQQLKDDLLGEGRAEVQADRERLRREIQTAQDQALNEIWSQAGHLATLISAKAIRRQLSVDDHNRLVDEALADFRQAAGERQRGRMGLS